ncbi:MAG: MFS transporter [Ktedonobacteraceae bacterium]|nr:MFS transporter [Ktedonobacteraceae bacterium]
MMLAFFVRGYGNTACNVYVNSVRQAITPDELRGRTNAVYRLVVSGVVAVGALVGGVLSERISLDFTLLIGAIGVSCSWLWLLCSPAFRIQCLPAEK